MKNNLLLLSNCTRFVSKLFLWFCFSSCPGRISSNYKNTKETKPNNTIAVFDTKAKPREVKVGNKFSKIRVVDVMTHELAEHFANESIISRFSFKLWCIWRATEMSWTRFFVLCSHIHFMYKYADDKILSSNLCLSNLGFCGHFTKRRFWF